MKKYTLALGLACSLFADSPVLGLDLEPNNKLKANANFGYISTTGNTETTTYALDTKLKKSYSKHMFELTFDGQYASDSDVETKNKYFTELEYNYGYTERFSVGYIVGFKQDKFSGYDYQFYTGPGAKYKAIKSELHNLSLESNFLYARDKFNTLIENEDTAINTYASLRLKALYEWKMLENLTFAQEVSYRTDVENVDEYFLYSKTSFTSKLSDMFTAGLSYKVDYANKVVAGIEHSDNTLSATLGVSY
jgi:putative salt-induced outer membrane protein